MRASRPLTVALFVAGGTILTGCGSASPPATAAAGSPGTCHYPVPAQPPEATPVPGSSSDWNVTSFDGTVIRAHWFPLPGAGTSGSGGDHPTVLMGPGWGQAGSTDTTSSVAAPAPGATPIPTLLSGVPIKDLWAAGYNVLTWDPRGFGASGGVAETDSPNVEARDVSTLIDWVATRPGVELQGRDDPRIGMVGGSYGGGIQLATAATDCRVDAIVPDAAWNSLVTSLAKGGISKIGWADLLTEASASAHVDPIDRQSDATADEDGTVPPQDIAWFASRGPGDLVSKIKAPTLLLQGTADNLFTLQEAVTNEELLAKAHTPVAMQWYCGGHGACLAPGDEAPEQEQITIAWLNRYVKGDSAVSLPPKFSFFDQEGHLYETSGWPVPQGTPLSVTGSGTLPLTATGGSGPLTKPVAPGDIIGTVAEKITPAPAGVAVNLPIPVSRAAVVVGAPTLDLTYAGTVAPGVRPTAIFAQIVDTTTGEVVGNQVTPVPLQLDGAIHTTTLPLEMIAYTATPASHLELQLVATTVAYAQPRLGGSVTFDSIGLTLPTAANITPAAG